MGLAGWLVGYGLVGPGLGGGGRVSVGQRLGSQSQVTSTSPSPLRPSHCRVFFHLAPEGLSAQTGAITYAHDGRVIKRIALGERNTYSRTRLLPLSTIGASSSHKHACFRTCTLAQAHIRP